MKSTKTNKKRTQDRILDFCYANQRVILVIIFLFALFAPIPPDRIENIGALAETSVNTWDGSLTSFYVNIQTSSINLINQSFVSNSLFFQEMIGFFIQLAQLNFNVINDSGYILIAIYVAIPIIILYSILAFIKRFQKIQNKENSEVNWSEYFSPKKLILLLMFIPFNRDISFVGTILAIFLLIYWYSQYIQEEQNNNRNLTLKEIISWKRSFFLIFALLFLIVSLLPSLNDEIHSIVSLTGFTADAVILGLIFVLIVLAGLWVVFQSTVSNKTIFEIFKLKYKEHATKKRIVIYLFILIFLISLINTLVVQAPVLDLVFIILNLPWILGFIIHDPIALLLVLIDIIRDSFDIIVDASRLIFNILIPTAPSNISIFGIIQSTLWQTMLLLFLFLILYSLFLIIYQGSEEGLAEQRPQWRVRIQKNSQYVSAIVLLFVLFIITYVFDSNNYKILFNDLYEIQTKTLSSFFILGVMIAVIGVVFGAIIWMILQIRKGRSWQIISNVILINGIAVITAIVMITPFIWMLKNSFQTNAQNTVDFAQQSLIPDPFTTRNYAQIFGIVDPFYATLEYRVITWLFNTLVAAVLVTAFLVIFAAMAGYVLAKRQFIGRKLLFTMVIAIMMVPPYVQIIPLYLELNRLDFVGSLFGLIFPFLIQPFSIFLAAEFMRSIPDDYLDAARVDGYSEFEIFRKVVLPLSIPVISVLIIINLIANWNSFIWPLLLIEQTSSAPQLRTLPLGIYRINAELQEQIGVILALSTIIIIPLFIILFLAQDYIKKGVTVEGLKG